MMVDLTGSRPSDLYQSYSQLVFVSNSQETLAFQVKEPYEV